MHISYFFVLGTEKAGMEWGLGDVVCVCMIYFLFIIIIGKETMSNLTYESVLLFVHLLSPIRRFSHKLTIRDLKTFFFFEHNSFFYESISFFFFFSFIFISNLFRILLLLCRIIYNIIAFFF